MGRQGIKRRKRKRELPEVADELSVSDEQRAFGNFRWHGFSPAGIVERHGFFWRQAARARDNGPGWRRFAGYVLTVAAVIALGIIVASLLPF